MKHWFRTLSVLFLFELSLQWFPAGAAIDNLVAYGSTWRYLDTGVDQGTNWITPSFNDSSWSTGQSELGYGDGDEATILGFGPDNNNRYTTYYFRQAFTVPNPFIYAVAQINLRRDDGVVVYLNGREVFRNNLPFGPITAATFAANATDDGELLLSTNVPVSYLVAGQNVIAAEIHQSTASSTDISFELELLANTDNNVPTVSIVSPGQGAFYTAPARVAILASAMDADGNLSLVEFFQGTTKLGEDTVPPYSFDWLNVPQGNYALRAIATDAVGAKATSAVVNVSVGVSTQPTIASRLPAPGNVSSLTSITVTFSETVSGVNAADLWINGVPATSVTGSNTTYTFNFPQPAEGVVYIGWNGAHGIVDFENPPKPFDAFGAGGIWQYTLADTAAPTLATISPPPGTAIRELDSILVTFNEPVVGVNAADLRINNIAATSATGSEAGPYEFKFAQPANGALTVTWAAAHGIQDRAAARNAFVAVPWSYSLNTNAVWDGQIVINEIMYHPGHDQASYTPEPLAQEYIELFNRGASAVNLGGWSLRRAVEFVFPATNLPAGGYLVVAANVPAFKAKYPAVNNVVGGWNGRLSNNRDEIELEDPSGNRVDIVEYADEGDWAVRTATGQGWEWVSAADGFGSSLELRQGALDNSRGQNWLASTANNGTPGAVNSVITNNIAPMILEVTHLPAVPRSTNSVTVLARLVDESANGLTVRLWRRDATAMNPFASVPMLDNGLNNDGAAGDRIFGVILPPQADKTITEFYVEAVDAGGRTRTWPAAANDGGGNPVQDANAFFQVDDEVYTGNQPFYRIIMRPGDRSAYFNQCDSVQRNATFITIEGSDVQVRHNGDARRRGAGSFCSSPPNAKFNIPRDRVWNNKSSLNLNAANPHAQVLGSAVALKSGMAAPYTRAVQLRYNGVNYAGNSMFGSYAHVEVVNSEWARDHFPEDSNGNIYSKRRPECGMEFRGSTPQDYVAPCGVDKESNASENDWTDLYNLFFALDPDTTPANDYVPAVRRNLNVELWLRHFAVLFLMNYNETAPATGVDDDYDLYRGVVDPRFLLLGHDYDTIFGAGGSSSENLFLAAGMPNLSRLLHHPEFEPLFYAEYRRQLAGIFSTNNLFPLMDQLLGDWVPAATIASMKNNALNRMNYVLSALPPATAAVTAVVSGEPDSPTYQNSATLEVSGADVTHYRYRVNNGSWSAELAVSQPINLASLTNGNYTVQVIGKNSAGTWQAEENATTSKTWAVISTLRRLVLNEVLARNDSAVGHEGTFPDIIELFNAGPAAVDLTGLRLTDDLSVPNKFTFPAGAALASGGYRVVFANNPDGTSGLHTGIGLSQDGDALYLLDRATNGNRVLDSVTFGAQLSNLSIGRLNNGQWGLCTPTSGSANSPVSVGSPSNLKINEWLASPASPFISDFVELYNPGSLPVNLGGLYLTDQPIGNPFRNVITPLSFIDGFGYRSFIADADADAGPNHLDFMLAAEVGEIALVSRAGQVIDCVVYQQQYAGRSQGRTPNGGTRIVYFDQPTPGAGNPVAPPPVQPQTVNLIPLNDSFTWKFEDSGSDLGTAWSATGFNDGAWTVGPGLFGFDNNFNPPEPIRTPMAVVPGKMTYYFRTHFNLPAGMNVSSLQASHFIDDGAVFYINGSEAGRYNMPGAPTPIDSGTSASSNGEGNAGETTLSPAALVAGDNVLAVEVHQSSQSSGDLVFGMRLNALIITNNPTLAGLKINEVLANARDATNTDGTVSDWVELYNPSNAQVDLTGMSFTDQVANPRRWVFPSGSIIGPTSYRVVRFDSGAPATTNFAAVLNTGFGLKTSGDSIYLFNRAQSGGELLDAVSFGIQAPDWSFGRVPSGGSNWVLTLPTPGALNIATTLGNPASLKINEWMAAPTSGGDWFEIFNPSAQPVELSGLYLTDDLNNRLQYPPIPPRSYMAGGLSGFLKIIADNTPGAGADHVPFALSRFGEQLGLSDRFGTLIDQVVFFEQETAVSEGRLPDGSANILAFPGTETPEESNYRPIPNVVINEVLTHSDPPLEDAIELRNTSASAVNIGGWFLSDARTALKKFRIPSNTIIPANGFRVFYENAFNPIPNDPGSFSLSSARGDEVYLSVADAQGVLTGYRMVVDFGPAANGVSFGRYVTSALNGNEVDFTAMASRTFGVDNPPQLDDFRTGNGLTNSRPLVGPVVISEIMYHPPDLSGGIDDVGNEFIELRNIAAGAVKLYDPAHPTNTWKLKDAVSYSFPPGLEVPANGFLVIVSFNPTNVNQLAAFRTRYNVAAGTTVLGPFEGKLDDGTDSVELARPDAPQTVAGPDFGLVPYILVDKVRYADLPPWPSCGPNCGPDGAGQSLQRINVAEYGNDPINWQAGDPHPGPESGSSDTDGDGMPNAWEIQYGLNPNVNDAGGDLDDDGVTNLDEYLSDTIPNNVQSYLRLEIVGSGPAVLRFNAAANKGYVIEFKDQLNALSWTQLTDVAAGPARLVEVNDPALRSQRFYRLRTP